MVPFIYDILLFLMLYVLYRSGKEISETGKIRSRAGFAAILVYTLNEGLRYGRGIDYNLYGMSYEQLENTGESNWDISFQFIARALISLDIPWQGYVLIMSFVFIVSLLIFLNNYKELLPYALPLFALFSTGAVENMVRWYMGFSFILIGLSYLIREENKNIKKFCIYSAIACTFHFALFLLPLLFYALSFLKKAVMPPMLTLCVYLGIAFFFQTDFMLQFIGMVNIVATMFDNTSMMENTAERIAHYGDDAQYWLTGGFAGTAGSVFPNIQELMFWYSLVYLGYKVIIFSNQLYLYAYNLFIIGFCLNPIANQIELVGRYDDPLLFFRAILLACIIEKVYIQKRVVLNRLVMLLALFIFLNIGRRIFVAPFKVNEEKYLYIWDSDGKSYQSMYDMWIYDMYNADSKKSKNE